MGILREGLREKMEMIARLEDYHAGSIEVRRDGKDNAFVVWIEQFEFDGSYWSDVGDFKTLAEAMLRVAEQIKFNAKTDFYFELESATTPRMRVATSDGSGRGEES